MSDGQESTMIQDQAFLAALAPFRQPSAIQAEALDLCGTYAKVKPVLQGLLPLLKAIPVIGSRAAQAVTVLMAALDALCPSGSGGSAPAAQAALAGSDQSFLAALDAFQPGVVSAQAFDLCGTYKKVKPILKGVAPFIKLIPVVGAPAGAAIDLLITALDSFCPGS